MKKNKSKYIARTAIVAALYAAVTMTLSWLSYGPIQFRISEIMVLLVFVDSKYFLGLVLGCILSNIMSPLGVVDVIVGTSATAIALLIIILVRKYLGSNIKALIIASVAPVITNAILVGIELTIILKEMPFLINALYVALGEFVVVTIAGTIIFIKIKDRIPKID